MDRREVSEPNTGNRRRRRAWSVVLYGALGLSVLGNAALATKILVFDPNFPFRPFCWDYDKDDLVEITEPLTEAFKADFLTNPTNNMRMGTDGQIYISRWDWWGYDNRTWHWNLTRMIAEYQHEQRTREPMEEIRRKYKTNSCTFIRQYAVEPKKKP